MPDSTPWPQLTDAEYSRLIESDDIDAEIRRILAERAPEKLPALDGGDDEC